MKKYAVCGNPIAHSLSPQIYSQLFKLNNFNACYSRILTKNSADAIYLFNEFKLAGMNVTAPFKSDIIPYISNVTAEAKQINAVNTIIRFKEQKLGFNTDWEGAYMLIKDYINTKNNLNILIIGAGNTATAAIFTIQKFYPNAKITIYNRTKRELPLLFQKCFHIFNNEFDNKIISKNDIIISTIPNPHTFLSKMEFIEGKHYIFADYMQQDYFNNIKNKNPNINIISGERWLVEQALPAFEYFYSNDDFCRKVELDNDTIQNHFNKLKHSHIWLTGFSGAGKTTITKNLAKQLKLNYIDTDNILEKQFNMSIDEYFTKYGKESFRKKEAELIEKIIKTEKNRTIISLGGGAIINPHNQQAIKNNNDLIIYIYTPLKTAINRININEKPMLKDNNIESFFNTRKDIYFYTSDLIVNNIDIAETTKLIKNNIIT